MTTHAPRDLPAFLTPVAAQVRALCDRLPRWRRVLLTTHQRPDGDAVGAILGLGRALRRAGKRVTLHAPDPIPTSLRFLPGSDGVAHAPPCVASFDAVFALDHSELARTGIAEQLAAGAVPIVAVDHHVTADRAGDFVLVLPDAAATCEILAHLLPALALPLDSDTATCLLTGIVADTGSFQHANTSPRVLRTASSLLERGANLRAIIRATYGGRPLPALRLIGRALERIQTSAQTGAAVSVITYRDLLECGASADDLSGVVNLLNTIPEADFSLLLTEYERGKLKGSLRSEPERRVDVSKIAAKFGGGGHRLASGFEVAGTLVRDRNGWRIA